jgi:formate hydrogenlyase subunit 6/NADH:ubiquinone oxidoreductase subunit I
VNLLGIIEKLAADDPERTGVRLQQDCCLHARARLSGCTACLDICPTAAIQGEVPAEGDGPAQSPRAVRPPFLNEVACVRCRACLPLCPTGAYRAADQLADVLQIASLHTGTGLELLCSFHPEPSTGPAQPGVAVQVRGCLAGLGNGLLLSLAVLAGGPITLRTETCTECPLTGLHDTILGQVEQTRQLLNTWQLAGLIGCTGSHPAENGVARPLHQLGTRTYSRRKLFGFAANNETSLPPWLAAALAGEPSNQPATNQRLLMASLEQLNRCWPQSPPSLAGLGLASLHVDEEACTACGTCARICPTAALQFEANENRFRLTLSAQQCIACELCARVCTPGAIKVETAPSYYQLFNELGPLVMVEGVLDRCRRCNGPYAARPGHSLCALCSIRRDNPFASSRPSTRQPL